MLNRKALDWPVDKIQAYLNAGKEEQIPELVLQAFYAGDVTIDDDDFDDIDGLNFYDENLDED